MLFVYSSNNADTPFVCYWASKRNACLLSCIRKEVKFHISCNHKQHTSPFPSDKCVCVCVYVCVYVCTCARVCVFAVRLCACLCVTGTARPPSKIHIWPPAALIRIINTHSSSPYVSCPGSQHEPPHRPLGLKCSATLPARQPCLCYITPES